MQTTSTEIADGIFRLSTHVAEIGPTGFTFNQFLIDDERPTLIHTGVYQADDAVRAAVAEAGYEVAP